MKTQLLSGFRFRPSLSFVLLTGLLVVLWLAGGASREDVTGQVIVRTCAWATLGGALLFCPCPAFTQTRPVWLLLVSCIVLALIQLVPLPPNIWRTFPGREVFAAAATLTGEPQPWRPWALVPGATVNAAAALIVPAAVLYLVATLRGTERNWLAGVLVALVVAAMLIGLLQFSGAGFSNPFVNDTPGEVSGSFANRNHFALFLALGCLVAPVWGLAGRRRTGNWRVVVVAGLVPLFALTILATGSRAGLLIGGIALAIGGLLVRHEVRGALRRAPRWVLPAILVGIVAVIAGLVLLSVAADRAVSISRALALDTGDDMRRRGLPTVLAMIDTYFPFGSGLGGFDPVFRLHEPFALLKPTYFNHAHNDFLEIVLDAGLPGLLLLLVAIGWWGWAGVRAWRAGPEGMMSQLGAAMILLVLIASAFDYPARTPMIMAVLVIAATWLSAGPETATPECRHRRRSALPGTGRHI